VIVDRSVRVFVIVGLVASVLVAVVVSQFASSDPDGLEYVAEREGFGEPARDHDLADTPLADYGDGLTGNSTLDTAIAGAIGVAVTALVGWGLFRLVRRRGTPRAT
jgi:hypothetical protein